MCRDFFLSTYSLSHSKLETIRRRIVKNCNPQKPLQEKEPHNKYSEETLKSVRQHIESYPKVESHYCRADTKREYLDANLSISKMYDAYRSKHVVESPDIPVAAAHKYYEIFCNEYNLGFHVPKKDLCDKCELYKIGELGAEMQAEKKKHEDCMGHVTSQRHQDMKIAEPSTLVVSFDMENIFALPRTDISVAFYKRKLNTINLTARVFRTKKAYCALWTESIAGRTGNDLASAFTALLTQIVSEHPDVTDLILWSDSCVAQNRNRMMAYALQYFLQENKTLKTITHRYCEPGHSNIQDVDNLHSVIERNLKGLSIMSPVSLVRQLKAIQPSNIPMYVKLLDAKKDFYDYEANTSSSLYSKVGFLSAKEILYTAANIHCLTVKHCFIEPPRTVQVQKKVTLRNNKTKPLPKPKHLNQKCHLSNEKKKDLTSLLKFMEGDDLLYMQGLLS